MTLMRRHRRGGVAVPLFIVRWRRVDGELTYDIEDECAIDHDDARQRVRMIHDTFGGDVFPGITECPDRATAEWGCQLRVRNLRGQPPGTFPI